MMMYILLLFITVIISCTTTKDVNQSIKSLIPPNGLYIKDGWFVDKTEVSNINYREYLHYLKSRYSSLDKYIQALPDTTLWKDLKSDFEFLITDYLRGESYDNLPVVGITIEQAQNYSKWRTDRVLEMILVEKNIIPINNNSKDGENFTVENYFTNEIYKLPKHQQLWYYPHFDLPTKDEWETLTAYNDSIFNHIHCDEKEYITSSEKIFDANSLSQPSNIKCKINELITPNNVKGNVCEWIKSGKMCGGGSFVQSLEHIQKTAFFSVKDKEIWVGFRNVCRMKKWELNGLSKN